MHVRLYQPAQGAVTLLLAVEMCGSFKDQASTVLALNHVDHARGDPRRQPTSLGV